MSKHVHRKILKGITSSDDNGSVKSKSRAERRKATPKPADLMESFKLTEEADVVIVLHEATKSGKGK